MNNVIYLNGEEHKEFNLEEDTIIYHFSIDTSSDITVNLNKEDITLYYYYNNINYNDNNYKIRVNHNKSNTKSFVYNHGVNVNNSKLHYWVDGYVPKKSNGCDCNQDNQIINMNDGNSKIWPNLLIDNFDVNANHAAYIGKFKEEDLFYIMSRGISRKKAYKLLLSGFLLNTDSIDKEKISEFVDEINKL